MSFSNEGFTPRPPILLVEDELIVIKVHTALLDKLGYQVDLAKTGTEAIQKTSNKYDLIFMDIGLPDINGINTISTIRQAENLNNNTPIVVLTGYVHEEPKEQCLRAGADAVFIKPITMEKLAQIVSSYMY